MSDIEVQQMEENILRGVALAYERLVEQKKKRTENSFSRVKTARS